MMNSAKKPVPLEEVHSLGDNQWMVPCIVDSTRKKFVPLMQPPKPGSNTVLKAPWTEEEDKMLFTLIVTKGLKRWTEISKELNRVFHRLEDIRRGKHCRERWFNHLNPELKKTDWTQEEDELILMHQEQYGNKWSLISRNLPGRTENAVKNRWKSIMRRGVKRSGLVGKVEYGGETGHGSGSHAEEVPSRLVGHDSTISSRSLGSYHSSWSYSGLPPYFPLETVFPHSEGPLLAENSFRYFPEEVVDWGFMEDHERFA